MTCGSTGRRWSDTAGKRGSVRRAVAQPGSARAIVSSRASADFIFMDSSRTLKIDAEAEPPVNVLGAAAADADPDVGKPEHLPGEIGLHAPGQNDPGVDVGGIAVLDRVPRHPRLAGQRVVGEDRL